MSSFLNVGDEATPVSAQRPPTGLLAQMAVSVDQAMVSESNAGGHDEFSDEEIEQ